MKELKQYKSIPLDLHLNFAKIPITVINPDDEGAEIWNKVVAALELKRDAGEYHDLVRTRSGGISIAVENLSQFPGFDIMKSSSMAELTVCDRDGCWRLQLRRKFESKEYSGRVSYYKFEQVCKKFGVNLEDFMLSSREEGLKVKEQIPKPIIGIRPELFRITLENVHHLDMHSAHMAGVAKAFPELRPAIQYCYDYRKKHPIYKDILTHSWGYFQSRFSPVYYRLSHLSKAGLENVIREVNRLSNELEKTGHMVIGHNTDGIWYMGEVYHGENEGKNLGQWENDYHCIKFRAKSPGCYEYIDDKGKYNPVLRGRIALDEEKPRDQWQWGDIFTSEKQNFYKLTANGLLVPDWGVDF